jgi:porin
MMSNNRFTNPLGLAAVMQAGRRRTVEALVVFVMLFALALPGLAQDQGGTAKSKGILPVPDYSGDLRSRSYLTGDWGGVRSEWADKGFQADIQFVQIVQSVVDGGLDTSTQYGGTLDYNINLDLDRMGLIPGGLVTFRAESRYGKSINGITGQLLPANTDALVPLTDELDQDIAITVTNLNYTQFLSEKVALLAGKLDTLQGDYNEFAGGGGRGVDQFMNYNLITNSPGAYPVGYSVLGGGIFLMPNENITIGNYLFTTTDSSTTSGFDTFDDGWTWNMEAYYKYKLANKPGGVMGAVMYSFDNDYDRLNGKLSYTPGDGLETTTKNDTWSFYFNGWQYLYVEDPDAGPVDVTNGELEHQGVGVFWRIAFADKDTNPAKFFASGGVSGRGVIPGRDDDTFGLGYFYTDIEETRLGDIFELQDHSQGFEAFYNLAITKAMFLSADFQLLDPIQQDLDTAVVLGARLKMMF